MPTVQMHAHDFMCNMTCKATSVACTLILPMLFHVHMQL